MIHSLRDVFHVCFECEVARVEQLHGRVWVVALVGFGSRGDEEGVVLAPDGEKWWFEVTKILVKRGIECNIGGVVEEDIQLNFIYARAREKCGVKCVGFGGDQQRIAYAIQVLIARGFVGDHGADGVAVLGSWVGPVAAQVAPSVTQAFLVGVSILRDDGGYALGMRDSQTEADGCAVVEDVDGVLRQPERGYEGVDGFGHRVEGVDILSLVRNYGKAEAGEVRCDDSITLRQKGN